uniref:Uncharacterized protein n=1 Tax=Arundo donax TaxID=35708 RepID=A0A0A9GI54_ARUDO
MYLQGYWGCPRTTE